MTMKAVRCPAVRHKDWLLIIGWLALWLLAGCATMPEENDPSEGGFIRAVQGVSGGQYEARKQARKEELARQQATGQQLQQRLAEIEAEQAEVDEEISAMLHEIEILSEEVDVAMRQLEALGDSNTGLQRDFLTAQNRLIELQRALNEQEYYSLSEIEQIGQSIREVDELVATLTAEL